MNRLYRKLLLSMTFCAGLVQHNAYGETLTFTSGAERVDVLELYTSQGCSSCPPADAWLNRQLDNPKLWREFIPLAFHVDYWDYLGWQDPYAQAAFSDRQRRYYQLGNSRSVYTPGFFLNGHEWRAWFRNKSPRLQQTTAAGTLTVNIDGSSIDASFIGDILTPEPLRLYVATLAFAQETAVARGENSGRRLVHEFVVTDLELIGGSKDSAGWRWQATVAALNRDGGARRAVAFWIAKSDNPAPLQATGGWLP